MRFRLRVEAPDFVSLGGPRYSGIFRREEGPWEATLGEWRFFLNPYGFFEVIEEKIQPND